ncbi:MAG TPA: TonB-dependent receptor [Proteiniphilum sp.]|nr:TonB-dependent receptor [Proteiniphilum sp.]HPR20218.1 TonB-dependent receptor [Proteiniphilum sp.]
MKISVKPLYTLLLFVLYSFSVVTFAQTGTIRGTVQFENGTPLVAAVVYIQALEQHSVTDLNGQYELKGIPYGTYQVEVRSIEAENSVTQITVDRPLVTFSPLLRESSYQLGEVIVKGATEKRIIETKGFAVNVIETEQEGLKNIQTNDLLNRSVGVTVRQDGGLGSAVNYNLNGMSGNSVRIFVDDIPISAYGSSFSLNSIPPSLIERIEVYKGVIPSHLTDDALGGAINVVLKKNMRNSLSASLSYGSFNTYQANLNGRYRDERTGFTLNLSGFHNYSDNDYEVWGKFVRNILPNGRYEYVRAKRFNDAYRSVGSRLEMGFTDVAWADQFFMGYNGSDDYNEIQHGTYMSIPYMGRFSESRSHAFNLLYRKQDLIVEGLDLQLSAVYSNRSQVVNDTVRWNYNWYGEKSLGLYGDPILRPNGAQQGAPTISHTDRDVFTLRSGLAYTIVPRHRVLINHSYYTIDRREFDEMRSAAEQAFVGSRDLQKHIATLSYEMTTFGDRLRSNLFTKFYRQMIDRMDPVLTIDNGEQVRTEERVNSTRKATGYGLALSYALLPELLLLSSAEKAVRMPSENEVFGSIGENIVENPHINPEVSNNLNIGFKAGDYYMGAQRFSFSATGFLRDTRDKIVRQINPRLNDAIQTSPFENLGKTQSLGIEAEANYAYGDRLSLLFNLSRFNTLFNMKEDAGGNRLDYYRKQMPNEPWFTFNSTAQYTLFNLLQKQSQLHIHYSFRFVESFQTTWLDIEDFRVPRQFIQDAGFSYLFPGKKIVVSFDVRNLFDRQVYDNFAVQKPGRAFYLKLNYTINHINI